MHSLFTFISYFLVTGVDKFLIRWASKCWPAPLRVSPCSRRERVVTNYCRKYIQIDLLPYINQCYRAQVIVGWGPCRWVLVTEQGLYDCILITRCKRLCGHLVIATWCVGFVTRGLWEHRCCCLHKFAKCLLAPFRAGCVAAPVSPSRMCHVCVVPGEVKVRKTKKGRGTYLFPLKPRWSSCIDCVAVSSSLCKNLECRRLSCGGRRDSEGEWVRKTKRGDAPAPRLTSQSLTPV